MLYEIVDGYIPVTAATSTHIHSDVGSGFVDNKIRISEGKYSIVTTHNVRLWIVSAAPKLVVVEALIARDGVILQGIRWSSTYKVVLCVCKALRTFGSEWKSD